MSTRHLFTAAALSVLLSACGGGTEPTVMPPVAPPISPPVTPPVTAPQAPVFAQGAGSLTITAGAAALFSGVVSGDAPITYQWLRNGVEIPGATEASYILHGVRESDAGSVFKLVARNAAGSSTSSGTTLSVATRSGSISVFAGRASMEPLPTNARQSELDGLAIGPDGSLYAADYFSLKKIDPSGAITSIGRPAAAVPGCALSNATAAPDGTVYWLDGCASVIYKVTSGGTLSAVPISPEGGSIGSSQFALAADAKGNLFVTSAQLNFIVKVDPAGLASLIRYNSFTQSGQVDGQLADASFEGPSGIAVDTAGNLYVADWHTIRKITPDGIVSTVAGKAGAMGATDGQGAHARFGATAGLAVDTAGNLYVADGDNHTLRKITPSGTVSTLTGRAGEAGAQDGSLAQARLQRPTGVVIDRVGNLYVSDRGNGIRKISTAGQVSTAAALPLTPYAPGREDGQAQNARFNLPLGLAFDNAGVLYVADSGNQSIRKLTPDAQASTLVVDSNGPPRFSFNPVDVAIDASGNVVVADGGGLYRVTAAGAKSTLWAGTSTDSPNGITIDPLGDIYTVLSQRYFLNCGTPRGGDCKRRALGRLSAQGSFTILKDAADGEGISNIRDQQGNTYLVSAGTVKKISPDGQNTVLAGSSGTPAVLDGKGTAARFRNISWMRIDGNNNLYVLDDGTLRKITPVGEVSTLAGMAGGRTVTLGKLPASLPQFTGFAVGADGSLYFTGGGEHAIFKVAIP